MRIEKTKIFEATNYLLGVVCLAALFFGLFIYAHRNIIDLDIWLHLKTGESIIKNQAVFFKDPFSFTLANKPWVDHAWLFQIIVYLVHKHFSFAGLLFLQTLVAFFSFSLFVFSVYERRNIFLTALGGYLLLYLYSSRLTTRPDIFSILFFSYFIFILNRFRNSKLIYTLIPVQMLWANFHGYYPLGLLLVAAHYIETFFAIRNRSVSPESLGRIRTVFLCLLAACFVSPYTYRNAVYPFSVLFKSFGENRLFFSKIGELHPTVDIKTLFDIEKARHFKILAYISGLSFFFNWSNFKLRDFFLWLFLLIFAATALRHVSYFAFFATVISVQNIHSFLSLQKPLVIKYPTVKIALRYLMQVFFILFVLDAALRLTEGKYFSFETMQFERSVGGLSESSFPQKAVNFISDNNLPQRMFNDFNSGNYLIGKTFPQRKVFIDGRAEFYGSKFFSKYERILEADPEAVKEAIAKYDLQGFLLTFAISQSFPNLLKYLYKTKEWVPVFLDGQGIIFLLDNQQNAELIKKFRLDLENWQPPEFVDLGYGSKLTFPEPYLKRSRVFKALELYDSQLRETTKAIEIYPSAYAYYLRGEAYFAKGKFTEAFNDFRKAALLLRSNPEFITGVGKTYLEMGRINLALRELNDALKINKEYSEAYYYLGLLFLKKNNPAGAIKNLELAIKYSPKKPEYLKKLAEVYLAQKQYDKAKEYAQKALELAKYEQTIKELLEQIQKHTNQPLP